MTRKNLLQAIYDNEDNWSCQYTCPHTMEECNPQNVCMECANRLLTEYEQKIRADAIEEIKQRFHNTYSASLYCQEDMATDCKEQGCNCDDCLYVMFNKVFEKLKE